MKSLFASRTFLLAVVQAVAGIYAAAVVVDPTITTLGWGMILKSVIDVLLRIYTSQPVYVK